MKLKTLLATAVAGVMFAGSSVLAGTLDDVRARGKLNCIINTGLAGFAAPDDKGKWQGFDVDFCRAVAAAVLGDADKVSYTTATGKTRFTKLAAGEGEILSRNTTWTFSRDVDLAQTFIGVNYYDGQGFMVPKKLGVKSAKELDGASVCIQTGTTTELNLAEFFAGNRDWGGEYEDQYLSEWCSSIAQAVDDFEYKNTTKVGRKIQKMVEALEDLQLQHNIVEDNALI